METLRWTQARLQKTIRAFNIFASCRCGNAIPQVIGMETKMADQAVHLVPSKNHRFVFLDALRGLAALLIVLHHAPEFLGRFLPNYSTFLAVDLFFVLSGFVIAFSYENRLSHHLSFRSFIAARFVRLYPVYLLGTALGFVLELYIHRHGAYAGNSWISWHSILFGVFLVPDFFLSSYVFPIDVPAWSLFGEIVGNIFYATLVRRRMASNRILAFLSLSSLFVLALWVLRVSGTLDVGSRRDSFLLGLARVGYSFFIGVLVYRIYHRNLNRLQIRGVLSWGVAGVICALVTLALTTNLTRSSAAQLAVVALLFPGLIYLGACIHLSSRWDKVSFFLGEMSYPLYLLHIPLFLPLYGHAFQHLLARHPGWKHFALPIVLAVFVMIAWWVARYYDRPVRRLLTGRYNAAAVRVALAGKRVVADSPEAAIVSAGATDLDRRLRAAWSTE
jgi:peptidoglycan/LPS O-acetylase OafA/YrhL